MLRITGGTSKSGVAIDALGLATYLHKKGARYVPSLDRG